MVSAALFIILVVSTLYHTLDTQKSMKPLFGHPVSKFWLRPWIVVVVVHVVVVVVVIFQSMTFYMPDVC